MNIKEESIYDFDNIYMFTWESIYQFTTVALLFWTDLISGFGTSDSDNISQWDSRIGNGLICFLNLTTDFLSDKCRFCMTTEVIFTVAYCFSYTYREAMMKKSSANSNAIISALAPDFSIFFWLIFTVLNK